MNRRMILLVALVCLLMAGTLCAQQGKPQPTENIYNAAIKRAASTDKNVMLIFHASWCVWCTRLDKAMESAELKRIFEDHYIIAHLDVMEQRNKVDSLENPGGQAVMKKLGGEKSGLPFYAFLDAKGNKIADSNVMPKNHNIGYPGTDEEIEAFGKLLMKTAKNLTDKELAAVTDYFK